MPGRAQPRPQLTTPTRLQPPRPLRSLPPRPTASITYHSKYYLSRRPAPVFWLVVTRGPPLSPWQLSTPPVSLLPPHIILSRTSGASCSLLITCTRDISETVCCIVSYVGHQYYNLFTPPPVCRVQSKEYPIQPHPREVLMGEGNPQPPLC